MWSILEQISSRLSEIDPAALYFFQSLHRPWLDQIMLALTHLGDLQVMISLGVAAAVAAYLYDQRRTAVLFLVALGLAVGTTEGVKRWVARPRPDIVNPVTPRPPTPSFPSGHAVLGMTVYGCIAVALGRRQTKIGIRLLIGLTATVLILLLGFTRLYLCVHYLTDVVGGWCAGLGILMLFLWADRMMAPVQRDAPLPGPGRLASSRAQPAGLGRTIQGDRRIGPAGQRTPGEG